jgi:RHS repeat-associated protein
MIPIRLPRHEKQEGIAPMSTMKKTTVAWMALTALMLLLPAHLPAQTAPTVRELVPASAPAGARVIVSGRGLADPAIIVAFGSLSATAVQRNDRFIEVVVPSAAASGNVRVSLGATLIKELPFTVAADPSYIVSTLAGGKDAKNEVFKHPNGAAVVLPDGNVAVADEQHHQIKLVTPAGVVSVLAGSGKQGSKDGKGAAAEFKAPRNLTFDPVNRVLYVSDTGNSNIRRVALDGTVTIVAGNGKQGYKDGIGVAAQFRDPHGLTVGSDGAVYVCDTKNNRIRRIAANGAVTTFAGTGAKDKLTDGALLSATFNEPKGIVADGPTLYVADTKNNAIRKIAGTQVTTVLSFPRTGDDDDPEDGVDGNPNVLKRPSGIGVDEAGNLIVSDSENDFIRRIRLSTTPATMITIAGTGKNGQVDGAGTVAQFKDPIGLSVAGAIYVADEDNDALRRLCAEVRATGLFNPTGAVTAGTEVRLFGTGFVPGGTTVKFGSTAATGITWISASELAVKLPATITGGSVIVTISSCGGTTPATTFVVDNSAPTLTITNGGAPLLTGALSKVPVTPVLAAADDIDPSPRVTATLNGTAFVSGTAVTADGIYTLVAYAEDAAGNRSATQTIVFTIDNTPPAVQVLEGTTPFPAGTVFNRPVAIDAKITDLTATTPYPTIDGVPYVLKQPYKVQGSHTFSIRVTDALGSETTVGPLAFTIDINGPALTITSHTEGQVVTARDVTITGSSDDAVSVKVNGVNAVIDTATHTFTSAIALLEGSNTITVTGADAGGNPGTVTRTIFLDTRAPELTIQAVASCTKSGSLELHGTVRDPHLDTVVVKLGDIATNATVNGTNWTATISLGAEGRKSILVEATDSTGHVATEQATVTLDKTAPEIELTESGSPFTGTIFNRKVTPFVRAGDADANTTVTATLNGAAWTSGTEIGTERSHTLRVKAKDCAGNEFTREQTFTIDLTPPRFLTFTPASGSKVTQVPAALTGTVDADAVEVRVVDKGLTTPAANGAFTLPGAGFADGVNELTLEVADRAGNVGQASYTLGIKTARPLVEIIEGGAAMVEGMVFTRSVKPEIRVFESNVTATATLDSAPFSTGTEVTAAGPHTITATATDSAFGQTNTITRHFTIDRTGPQVTIVSPANGAALDADRTAVRVTAADAVDVAVNGIAAVKQADASWIASNVPLDFGETVLVAVGHDAAGNSGSASVTVTRGGAGPALVLTFPPDNYVTNRPKLDVTGRVLREGSTVSVIVPPASAASVATDPVGTFRVSGAQLQEGEWTVTATATEGGKSTSVQARVIADFTPPRVSILESGVVFEDGAGFGTQAVISGTATDRNQAIDFALAIDGATVASPVTITANGGHTAILTARDAAGNEARLERTFYIGTGSVGGCRLEAFDPPDQSIIASQKVELIGRSGGAPGIKVNGVAAKMSNGSFCASVELPQEGPNTVTIVCTDADGTPLGDPVTITLVRVTNEPSVTITTPAEDYVTHDATIVVNGTLGNGAVSVDVNSKPATINGTNWTVTGVRLTDGVNVLVARARNNAGRTAVASRRITYIADPPAISISSPVPGFVSGVSTTDVSGTFSNVDPSSLAIPGFAGAVEPTAWSDTTGRFVARNVPLQSGDNTVAVTGRDRTGRLARAEVAIRYLSTSPVVTIAEPADGDYFPASQGDTFRVSGTFRGDEGSTIDVNGVSATVDGTAKTFFADVTFSTLPGGITPVVARIAQPSGGEGAFDSLRVYKLSDAQKVLETFPAANAFEVDPGVVILALFSAPMDSASTAAAFRLENASGAPVNGKTLLDKDVLTFAPATTLTPGERYTIRIATTATDLAGQPLETAVDSSFVVATSAPTTAPTITTASGRICAQLIDVTGTSIPGARVRLDYGQISFTTNASATGAFSYKIPLPGQAGYHVIRVRTVGADGTLSAAAELKLNLDCTGPRVLRASYDRDANQLTIVFSNDVKPATLTAGAAGSIQLVLPDDRVVGGAVAASGANVTVVPAENLGAATFTLKVTRDVEDLQGRELELVHTQLFAIGDDGEQLEPGYGFISGEVYDATTGRPLAGADIAIEVPTAAFARRVGTNALTAAIQAVTMTTDARGRYTKSLPEGAHTIRASASGYTSVWRQIIVPAGAGVIPIDIRLTRRGETKSADSGALSLVHGGNSSVTRRAELAIPAGAITAGASVTLTSTGAQSLAGLLPLGWSPLASAEIVSTASTLGASTLTFDVPQADITAASQTIAAVRYDESRDEWRVLVPVVNVANGKASFDAAAPGAYGLVYADRRPGLAVPTQSSAGAPLTGVADPCADGSCPAMVAKSFPLSPDVVLPTGSTVATLNIDGAASHLFPSGTAVQAYIDEELRLADGGRELPTPFATDLLLYRDLAGNGGVATFNLAPSPRAAEVFLEVGFDHIRILPYPGRLDRGTLIGPEGGRVPADDKVAVEIPTGATQDALRATASSLADPTSLGPIAGYTIVGGFQLTLERASESAPTDIDGDGNADPTPGVELSKPARATFTVDASTLPIPQSASVPPQLILAELLETTPFNNRIFRLTVEMAPLEGGRWTTKAIDRNVLPIDGVIREGRYVLLAANAPIAFARGVVKFGNGAAARDARVSAAGLGVADLSRVSGIFSLPVAATPAAPFTLVPRAVALGDGATYTHGSSPAAGAVVNVGDLMIVAQPPQVTSTIPANNATDVSLTTTVEATIAPGIDPSSINASSLTVIDTTNGTIVPGTVTANGVLGIRWTLPPGETLQQGRRYVAAVASTVRGTNGTPLEQAYTFSFTTAVVVTNEEVHPDRIRITIPDANGVSKVIGTAGALKAGWLAVPVRRDRDFLTRYSQEAATDGSFSVTIGTNPRDRVSISDTIDLRVLNNNGALIAIIPLTPFVSEDGKSFIAPAKTAVTFHSVDGYSLEVPAGAFDTPTQITLKPASPTAFAGVPQLAQELILAGTVDVQFEGRARQPLQITIPVTPGTDLNREAFLAVLGQSLRGPRLMAIDTLTVVDGKLTTKPPAPSGARRVRANDVVPGNGAKDMLQKFIEAGQYAAAMMHPDRGTLAWSFVNTGATVAELTWDTLHSMYVGPRYIAESDGVVAFPVPAGTRFVLTATDPATSLRIFEETYNGIPVGAPGTGTPIAAPDTDFNGPHPVFATPFRVETASAPPPGVTLQAVRDVELALSDSGQLTISGTGSMTAAMKVTALDVQSGERRGPAPLPMTLPGTKAGDEIVLIIEEEDVDPATTISVVFNEPIDVGGATSDDAIDASLRSILRFERADTPGAAGTDLLKNAFLRLDSSGRRVTIALPSLLEAGVKFRLTLDVDIEDRSGNNLKLGQAGEKAPSGSGVVPIGPTPAPMELWFKTRGPQGTFAEFDIRQTAASQFGSVREIAQYDNLLFVAAVDGGVLAYDVSDPAALDNSTTPKPIAIAPGRDNVATSPVTDYWSVHVDHHGRVFSTGMSNMFGALRTWRVEDFIKAKNSTVDGCLPTMKNTVCQQTGGAITSQNPGTAYGVGLPSAVVSDDRVEAIPRKAKFVIGDADPVDYDWTTFVAGFCGGTASDAGDGYHQKCNAEIPASGSSYRMQRITVENRTLGLRWSEDAIDGEPAKIGTVIAAPGDEVRVTHNLSTYAVVSLLGYGIGVFDVNGIESNEVPGPSPAGIARAREQVVLRANAEDTPMPSGPQYVGNLAFSPESHILGTGGDSVKVYTLDTRKGVIEFLVTPPASMSLSGKLILTGGMSPRFDALKAALVDSGIANPVVRFSTGALYHNPNTNKDYLLIAALDYGLVAVEVGAVPLSDDSFADVVPIKDAAWAVRVIDRTNMAVVVDGTGRVSIVDLSRIDERSVTSAGDLFPTAANALGTGTQDPRILWKSEHPIAIGNIAPVVDPDTGILIGADLLGKRVRVASVFDPKVRFVANIGAAGGGSSLKEVGSVVPLGIEPPAGIVNCDLAADPACRGSLGVFRIEARLPGSMTETLISGLQIALESERVAGADTQQTPDPYPVAHLRFKKRDGNVDPRSTTDFKLNRVLDFASSAVPELRYQKGWNRFASDWVVAIADPRAAKAYGTPPTDCPACKRPTYLSSVPDVREIYTMGRFLAVRPELTTAGAYGFLAQDNRFQARISTTPADTVRPLDVLVASQHPPVAHGMLQETTYVHSGEVETSHVDFDAGGRASWNVRFDRVYRSRTLGLTPFGTTWDSSQFRRLRALPKGDVEYRDGAEVWLFKSDGAAYTAPVGTPLKLTITDSGWTMIDQKWRVSRFDQFGRLVSEGDEYYDPLRPGSGNIIHYIYDDDGSLANIVDPVGRGTEFFYWTSTAKQGLLQKIKDWRNREVEYDYDSTLRLEQVKLVDVTNTTSGRPFIKYGYAAAGTSYKDELELAVNLETITDPTEAVGGGAARVKFTYQPSGPNRDRVTEQKWGTGESATFAYSGPGGMDATDVRGQVRRYKFTTAPTDAAADRVHISELREVAVPVYAGAAFGQLPAMLTAGPPSTSPADRTFTYGYLNGERTSTSLAGVRSETASYTSAAGAPGQILQSVTSTPAGSSSGSLIPAPQPSTTTFSYQSGANASTFLRSVSSNGQELQLVQSHRNELTPAASNDSVQENTTVDMNGMPAGVTTTGGTDGSGAGSSTTVEYFPADDGQPFRRALPRFIREGGGALQTEFRYPDANTIEEIDARGTTRRTEYDAWRRPVHVKVTKPADPITIDERWKYDATGRVKTHIELQDGAPVETTYAYDVMGRRTFVKRGGVSSPSGSTSSTIEEDLAANTTVVTYDNGAKVTTETDGLGRVRRVHTFTGSMPGTSPIVHFNAYDVDGNLAFTSDGLIASAMAYDAQHRQIAARRPDGTLIVTEYDGSGNPKAVRTYSNDGSPVLVGEITLNVTASGRIDSVTTNTGSGSRVMDVAWDGGGRATSFDLGGRARKQTYDSAGRLTTDKTGEGSVSGISDPMTTLTVGSHDGPMTEQLTATEKGGSVTSTTMERNLVGGVTSQTVGSLEWTQKFDSLGKLVEHAEPNRDPVKYDVDSRGAIETETLPGGASNSFDYDASGVLKGFTDPSSEATNTQADLIGRPVRRDYADGSAELVEWQGERLRSFTDRQGRKQVFDYNGKGQVEAIRDAGGTILDRLAYDSAGRLTSWSTKDVALTWSAFDMEGKPQTTTQKRFKDETGLLGATLQVVLDEYTQNHVWNEQGERTSFTMPAYSGLTFGSGWTASVSQVMDAAGNVKEIRRNGDVLMTAEFRNAGRPDKRTVVTAEGHSIVRTYGYEAGTGLLNRLGVAVNGDVVAGSAVTFDGTLKTEARLLGISAETRATKWRYDVRSRLSASVFGAGDPDADPLGELPGRAKEDLSDAGFRSGQNRVAQLDATQRAALEQRGIDTTRIDPPSLSFTEAAAGGHKIGAVTRGSVTSTFVYNNSELVDDGRFTYEFDAKGRLIHATEKTGAVRRRVTYSYTGTGRLIGRRAEFTTVASPSSSDWVPENRPQILAADGLPAETTFVWDPISDRLVTIARAGATSSDPHGGLLKQIIHGGLGYDDPIETTTIDPLSPAGVNYLYPIYDEAGAGSLQAVVNKTGQVLARNLSNDPYGAEELDLGGAAVDRVSLSARKTSAGAIQNVDVRMRLTELVAEPTLAGGIRLAVVDADGNLIRTATASATLVDPFTVGWTLNQSQWTALVNPAPVTVGGTLRTPAAISIAATSELRASAWVAELEVLPAPVWTVDSGTVFSSSELRIEIRESLTSLTTFINAIPGGSANDTTLYEVENLAMLAAGSGSAADGIVSARMHAHPFTEPLTELNYVRERWYDPRTASWLTPDPLGYKDSTNLYAFAGGDPVNQRDPSGRGIRESWNVLVGYGKGVGTVLISPGILTYNLTGGLLYATTGGEQYRDQYEASVKILNGLGLACSSPAEFLKMFGQGLTAGIDQMIECAEKGDEKCTAEGLGNLVGVLATLVGTAGSTNITVTPARQFAYAGNVVSRSASGTVTATSPYAGAAGTILLSNSVNESGKGTEGEGKGEGKSSEGKGSGEGKSAEADTKPKKQTGKLANEAGEIRVQRAAEYIKGRKPTPDEKYVKTSIRTAEIDLIGPNGELIEVGGPSKLGNNPGSQFKVLAEAAKVKGTKALVMLEEGTSPTVIEIAKRFVGEDGVIIFPK